MTRPNIALTLGDPSGIGPELAAKLLSNPENIQKANILVLASLQEVLDAAAATGVHIPIVEKAGPEGVQVLDDGTVAGDIRVGEVSLEAGERTMHQLRRGMALATQGLVDGMVSMPINKSALHLAGMREEDELRWFGKELEIAAGSVTSEINIIDEGLWTARVTSHVALKDVSARVTVERVTATIELLNRLLKESGVTSPRIGVCALNPHNGENGSFGREEIEAIIPGVRAAQLQYGVDVRGPFPSDTIFLSRKEYDGIVTMYHDQGQIAIKLLGFEGGVTVQGGLPIVISTPAHGTAFEIVGKNIAKVTSSQRALDIAIRIAATKAARRELEKGGSETLEITQKKYLYGGGLDEIKSSQPLKGY